MHYRLIQYKSSDEFHCKITITIRTWKTIHHSGSILQQQCSKQCAEDNVNYYSDSEMPYIVFWTQTGTAFLFSVCILIPWFGPQLQFYLRLVTKTRCLLVSVKGILLQFPHIGRVDLLAVLNSTVQVRLSLQFACTWQVSMNGERLAARKLAFGALSTQISA